MPHTGYSWTWSREFFLGTNSGRLDIADEWHWGITLDFNVKPGAQLSLLYNRQNTDLVWRSTVFGASEERVPVGVEYWHIGGNYGVYQGNLMPFTSFTLGATRYDLKYGPQGQSLSRRLALFHHDRVGGQVLSPRTDRTQAPGPAPHDLLLRWVRLRVWHRRMLVLGGGQRNRPVRPHRRGDAPAGRLAPRSREAGRPVPGLDVLPEGADDRS